MACFGSGVFEEIGCKFSIDALENIRTFCFVQNRNNKHLIDTCS